MQHLIFMKKEDMKWSNNNNQKIPIMTINDCWNEAVCPYTRIDVQT
jgi:hypothetical protein